MSVREEQLEKFRKEFNLNEEELCEGRGNRILLNGISLDEWHRRMWDWLAIYGVDGGTKQMFIDANFDDGCIRTVMISSANCFACLYDNIFNEKDECELCPIGKFDEDGESGCLDGLYVDYEMTPKEEKNRKHKLARKIENLNWEWK